MPEAAVGDSVALRPIDQAPEAGVAAALLWSSCQDTIRLAGFVTVAAKTSPYTVSGIASTAAITARVICVGVDAPEVTPTRRTPWNHDGSRSAAVSTRYAGR